MSDLLKLVAIEVLEKWRAQILTLGHLIYLVPEPLVSGIVSPPGTIYLQDLECSEVFEDDLGADQRKLLERCPDNLDNVGGEDARDQLKFWRKE